MKALKDNWFIFEDEILLANALSQEILRIAEKSIKTKNSFSIVLTGGKSVLNLYTILVRSNSDWDKWHIYISDERCLPKNHMDRNDRVINEIWLDSSVIPKENIHFIRAELGLSKAREEYEKTLKNVDMFDIVLLSMGEDGHIASLFPGHAHPKDQNVIVERNSPKPPEERISMSYGRLNKSNYSFKLIIGDSKQEAVNLLKRNINLPISQIQGNHMKTYLCNVLS
jgi:6-phosphogluconolactonase